MKKILCVSAAIVCSNFAAAVEAGDPKAPPSGRQFSREEFMVLHLNSGNDSTGAHVAEAQKQLHNIVRELDKSLRQLQQVDREFAKSKGKPDDRFLNNAADALQKALSTSQQLEKELGECKVELKDSIHSALIMAQ